jgi:hypothetical protein
MDMMQERMEKMKEHADRHWKETSCLEQKIKDLQFLIDYQVESLNFDRIRELENEVDNYDAWLGGARQIERELHARIGELEAKIDGLQALTLEKTAEKWDNYSSDDDISFFSHSDDDGST